MVDLWRIHENVAKSDKQRVDFWEIDIMALYRESLIWVGPKNWVIYPHWIPLTHFLVATRIKIILLLLNMGINSRKVGGFWTKNRMKCGGVPGVPYLEADQVASWKIASQDVTNEKGLTVVPQKSWPAPRHASFSRNFPSRPKWRRLNTWWKEGGVAEHS